MTDQPEAKRGALAAFLILAAAVVVLRAPAARVAVLNEDEALYAATAAAMSEGEPPYLAGVEDKPPGIFYVYQGAFALVGRYNLRGLHILTIPWVFATGIFVGLVAGELTGRRRWHIGSPRFWGALLYYGFAGAQQPQVLATQPEIVYSLPLAVAAWLILRASRSRWKTSYLAAGVLIGLSTVIKPTAVSLFGATLGWLGLTALLGGVTWRAALARAAMFGAGFVLPWLGAWRWFSHLGVWDDLVYYSFRFTLGQYLPHGTDRALWLKGFTGGFLVWFGLAIGLWLLAGTAAVGAFRRRRQLDAANGPTLLVALWVVAATAMTFLSGRFYDQYFPAVVPPLAALGAAGVAALRPGWGRRAIAALAIVPVVACWVGAWDFRGTMHLLRDAPPDVQMLTDYVADHSRPDQRVFVWGYLPRIYVAADRLAASRFVGCHFLTGYAAVEPRVLPPALEDPLGVPGGFDVLLGDLDLYRPELVIDIAPLDLHHWAHYPLARYPKLADWVAAHYQREAEVEGAVIYRRKSPT